MLQLMIRESRTKLKGRNTMTTTTNTFQDLLGQLGIPVAGIAGAMVEAFTGLSPAVMAGVEKTKPAYEKYDTKVADAIKVRGGRIAHAAIELKLDDARDEAEKLSKQLGRLQKINDRVGSTSAWNRFKGRCRRAHYNARYALR